MVQNCESVTNIYSQLFPRLERTNQVLYVCMYVYAKIGLKNMYTSKPTANAFLPPPTSSLYIQSPPSTTRRFFFWSRLLKITERDNDLITIIILSLKPSWQPGWRQDQRTRWRYRWCCRRSRWGR